VFEVGKVYRRRDIHDELGGQRQGGISTPSGQPFLLLFTGEAGRQYGYVDGWTEDGVFLYTGEGQQGDMEFTRGNRAIRDHAADGRDLHLFRNVGKGCVEYVGWMVCTGHEVREGTDGCGGRRKVIVFELTPWVAR